MWCSLALAYVLAVLAIGPRGVEASSGSNSSSHYFGFGWPGSLPSNYTGVGVGAGYVQCSGLFTVPTPQTLLAVSFAYSPASGSSSAQVLMGLYQLSSTYDNATHTLVAAAQYGGALFYTNYNPSSPVNPLFFSAANFSFPQPTLFSGFLMPLISYAVCAVFSSAAHTRLPLTHPRATLLLRETSLTASDCLRCVACVVLAPPPPPLRTTG